MRRCVFGLIAVSLLSGCQGVITKELRHPGGYPGSLLDKRMIDASGSKSVQLLRSAMIIAMASRMATVTIRDGKDADAFVDYLAAAVQDLNYAASNLYGEVDVQSCLVGKDGATTPCRAYFINFEADVPMLENRIIRLMVASLPEDRARKFLEDVAQGDVLGAAWSGIRATAITGAGLRNAAAVFRSNIELAASLNPECGYEQSTSTVHGAAVECFKLPTDKLFTDQPIRIDGVVPTNAFDSVLLIAQTSCARLPLDTEGGVTTGQERRNDQCKAIVFEPKFRSTTQD